MKKNVSLSISLFKLLRMKNFSYIFIGNLKTQFKFTKYFSANCEVYEIMYNIII